MTIPLTNSEFTELREDKLMRSGDTGIDGSMLRAAKRAIQAGDEKEFKGILSQLSDLCALAVRNNDKNLQENCRTLVNQIGRIIKTRGAAVVIETKAATALRTFSNASDEDIDEIASAGALGEISGYGAVFNNTDLGGDVILPGAFRRTLAEWKADGRLPVMLAQHDNKLFPVGVWTSMQEDTRGLRVVGKVANTPRGREVWALTHMTPRALDGLSIGYSVARSDFRKDGARELKDLDLFEISIVALPMNPKARLDVGKSIAPDMSAAFANLKRAIRGAERQGEAIGDGSNVLHFPSKSDERDLNEKLRSLAAVIQTTANQMRTKR